jgi:hypothetical protein
MIPSAVMKKLWIGLGLAWGLTTGCAAPVGISNPTMIPPDAVAQCREQCNRTGLVLGSVVIMANHLGCVCNPANSPTACTNAAAGGAAGAMAQIVDEEAAKQQTQHAAH